MPIFICNFIDGEQTCMTVYCRKGLDMARGVKLARYAYESRKRQAPPPILGATFVSSDDGRMLAKYGADELMAPRLTPRLLETPQGRSTQPQQAVGSRAALD